MADIVKLMNTILANASTEYQNRVPEATRDNIASVGNPIMTYQAVQNEFLSALVNRIALVIVHSKIATNPLAILKNGNMPLGKDIEEIYTNPAKSEKFDATGANLLTRVVPDTKVLYHRENRQDQYTVTISREMLAKAFTSWNEVEKLIQTLVNTLYSGDNYDEFLLTKKLIGDTVVDNKVRVIEVDTTATDYTKALVKALNTASKLMAMPSDQFNSYALKNPTRIYNGESPVITWTPLEDQILILRADIATAIDIDVLAVAFNMSKTDILAKTLVVDTIGDSKAIAILADKSWVKVTDTLSEMTEFYNAKGLYWNYYWNHWQVYSTSLFCNAIAILPTVATTALDATNVGVTVVKGKDYLLDTTKVDFTPSGATNRVITVAVKTDSSSIVTNTENVNNSGIYKFTLDPSKSGTFVVTLTNKGGASGADVTKDLTVTVSAS